MRAKLAIVLVMVVPTAHAEDEEAPDYAERTLSGGSNSGRRANVFGVRLELAL
jgi:hypothetical protein